MDGVSGWNRQTSGEKRTKKENKKNVYAEKE
jgi:hypothetical protein